VNIAECRTFHIGRFTVWQRPRQDNPFWPVYIVFVGERLVGKSFSLPNLDCCRWLERWGNRYAEDSAAPRRHSANQGEARANERGDHRGVVGRSNGRNGHRRRG
jgi:hypothetical protein